MQLLAVLLLGPWLAVLAWLYWLYVRRTHGAHTRASFDALILVLAGIAAIAGADVAYGMESGVAGAIWKQVAAVLVSYTAFSTVLAFGLARHVWLRKRRA
ncbi:MAG TPA: hypothetical protein VN725_03725 [Rhodanobacteraceae bacterium]|nr:hypothetical protein [Rhodanobacteraceae bacterium]